MNKYIASITVAAVLSATASMAAHNNPWAEPEDSVEGKNHDTNQAYSADRPGEDEMHGVQNTEARETVPGPGGQQEQ